MTLLRALQEIGSLLVLLFTKLELLQLLVGLTVTSQ